MIVNSIPHNFPLDYLKNNFSTKVGYHKKILAINTKILLGLVFNLRQKSIINNNNLDSFVDILLKDSQLFIEEIDINILSNYLDIKKTKLERDICNVLDSNPFLFFNDNEKHILLEFIINLIKGSPGHNYLNKKFITVDIEIEFSKFSTLIFEVPDESLYLSDIYPINFIYIDSLYKEIVYNAHVNNNTTGFLLCLSPTKYAIFWEKQIIQELMLNNKLSNLLNYVKFNINHNNINYIFTPNPLSTTSILQHHLLHYNSIIKSKEKYEDFHIKPLQLNFCISSELKLINPKLETNINCSKVIFFNDTNMSAQIKKDICAVKIYNLQSIRILDQINKLNRAKENKIEDIFLTNIKEILISIIDENVFHYYLFSVIKEILINTDEFSLITDFLNSSQIWLNLWNLFCEEKSNIIKEVNFINYIDHPCYYIIGNNIINYKIKSVSADIESVLSKSSSIDDKTKLTTDKLNNSQQTHEKISNNSDIHHIHHNTLNQCLGYCLENLNPRSNYIDNDEEYYNYERKHFSFFYKYCLIIKEQIKNFLNFTSPYVDKNKKITIQKIDKNIILEYLNSQKYFSIVTLIIISFLCDFSNAIRRLEEENQFTKPLEGFNEYGVLNDKSENTIIDFAALFLSIISYPNDLYKVYYTTNDKGIKSLFNYCCFHITKNSKELPSQLFFHFKGANPLFKYEDFDKLTLIENAILYKIWRDKDMYEI